MGEKIRVMVAEDMDLLREDVCDVVGQQEDMEIVGWAASGLEICALAKEMVCDIILMDIEMETMQAGVQAAEQIHQFRSDIRIIFMTAQTMGNVLGQVI